MGTPDFAVGTLKELIDNQYDVVAVVTQPDKPRFFSQKEQEMKHLLKN